MSGDGENWYGLIGQAVGGLVFVVAWIFAIMSYGFLWGLGLGWLPAGILGAIVGLLWPLAVLFGLAIWLDLRA